ncbi:hypothetical protein Tco_0574562, partial [Tanacetum coccineum]
MVASLTTGLNVSSQSMPCCLLLPFVALERVTIGCFEVGGGGGGVTGGVGVVCGDGVDSGVG